MKIVSLQVSLPQLRLLGDNQKLFTFDKGVNIIYSKNNSVGKTTLLRMLMFSLGYPIPNTRGINFYDYKTVLKIIGANESIIILTRNGNYIEALYDGEEKEFSLPVEQRDLHSLIFGITNIELVDNLLGAFYVDQEKGWTLLNRGKVIGNNHFSIESLLCGLSNRSNVKLNEQLSATKRELHKYEYMLDVAAYKAKINQLGEGSYIDSPADEIENSLDCLYCERKPIKDELTRIKSLIQQNISFEKYITSFCLRVKDPSSNNEIPVNKDTLVGYGDTLDLLLAKRDVWYEKLTTIDNKIDRLKKQLDKEDTLFEIKTSLQRFDYDISKIDVDPIITKRKIDDLNKECKELEHQIINNIKKDNPLIETLHELISTYSKQLDLDEISFNSQKNYIFTNDLKSMSGAIFHKIVFAFKISYIKLIQQVTGLYLPVILDSPSGREVSSEIINKMIEILSKDFSDYQIIIASINNYAFPCYKTIELTDRLLPF